MKRVAGSVRGRRTKGFFAETHHDYSSFTRGCNWRDFTFVKFSGEWNHMTGRAELYLALLGFHVDLTYVWDDSFMREMMDRRDEMIARDDSDFFKPPSETIH